MSKVPNVKSIISYFLCNYNSVFYDEIKKIQKQIKKTLEIFFEMIYTKSVQFCFREDWINFTNFTKADRYISKLHYYYFTKKEETA